MSTIVTVVIALVLILFSPLLIPIAMIGTLYALLGPLMGAIVGWVLGLTVIGQWISEGAALFGLRLPVEKLWLAGAFLGYVGGYFRGASSSSSNSSNREPAKKTLLGS